MLNQIKAIVSRSPRILLADTLGILSLMVMLIGVLHLTEFI